MTNTHYALLGMLTIGPLSGYDIRRLIAESTQAFWSESDGQLYPALAKLTELKLITIKPTPKKSSRGKKIYSITPAGRNELKKWLNQPPATAIVRNEMLLKLFFGANIAPDILRDHIEKVRYETKAAIQQLKTKKQNLTADESELKHLPFWQMTLQYGIRLNEAKLLWCDETLKFLKQKEESVK